VLVLYGVAFKTTVNEHTAALVLPVVLLAMVAWDRLGAGRADLPAPARGLWPALTSATGESSHHVGALLLLMCGSVGLGGVVERAEVMALVPASFGSIWLAMSVIVVVMVLVGMTMDPLGAVVLVSITIARVADDNGIAPVHFWMVVLVGFELGYLTPPVALNQLLARSVIGPEAEVESVDPKEGFFERYSHVIVPCGVMATALVIVAFVPLLFY
jgi:TRAP-type C4-dicarboxylate transport system permease large subunit